MSTFTLAISCLTTSNLLWFMDLTFQVPMQYCSLQHRTLLPSPVTSTAGCCFCFASVSSFFLELFLHWSPVAYFGHLQTWGVHLSVSYVFLPFHTVHGVLKARILKWFPIPFSSGPHFVRTCHHDPSILGGPTWHGSEFHWVRQGCGPCNHWLVSCDCGFQSVCPLSEMDKRLMEASWWERLTEGEIGSCSDVRGHVQYTFNPVFCWCVGLCSLPLIYLEPNYGGGNEDNGDLHQKVPCIHCCSQYPQPCSRPLPTHTSTGDPWTL